MEGFGGAYWRVLEGRSGEYVGVHVRELPCSVYSTGGYRRGVVEAGTGGFMSEICHVYCILYWRVLEGVLEGIEGWMSESCHVLYTLCEIDLRPWLSGGSQAGLNALASIQGLEFQRMG